MVIKTEHVLAVAVSTGRLGYAFLVDGTPYDWGLSLVASSSARSAHEHTTAWIEYYQPQLVVTERIDARSRKGTYSRELNNAILKAAQDTDVQIMCVDRIQRHGNKYAEARALADRFPELQSDVPRPRKQWESEPRKTVIFEAVAIGMSAIEDKTIY